MKRIELELIRVMFISGDTASFWIRKGLSDSLRQDFKFLEAYGATYDDKVSETVIGDTLS